MKKSGYRAIYHIYLMFFLALSVAVLAAFGWFWMLVTVPGPGGQTVKSDWPRKFTEEFQDQIVFDGRDPGIRQAGMELLLENGIGLQLLDASGREVLAFQKPEQADDAYSAPDLLNLCRSGHLVGNGNTSLGGVVSRDGISYVYLLHFPVQVSQITMYLNGERFTGGKAVILPAAGVMIFMILGAGGIYGFWMARAMGRLAASVGKIAERRYIPEKRRGVFRDVYGSLDTMDEEIREGDRLRAETDQMREEWIANITHDLKTPLSPIKGYAELLMRDGGDSSLSRRYGEIMLKNAGHMEALIDDLKLMYQLESGMIPVRRKRQDVNRFLKETVIDILNTPEYEGRTIHFEGGPDRILYSFDETLLARVFCNLIINAFVHGNTDTVVSVGILSGAFGLQVVVSDDGKGMTEEEVRHLFDRYYRGTQSGQKPEGTGLGLAIVKSIVELHGGRISVSSVPGAGSAFRVELPAD